MPSSSILGLDWPALQFIGQVASFIGVIIGIAVATHKVTKKITADSLLLDGRIKVLEERANNMKTQTNKSEAGTY
jgi:hypothetical protein